MERNGKERISKVAEGGNTILCGDALEVLKTFPDNCIDTVITDPPYELGFMGKSWDRKGVSFRPETWAEVLRVAKPGALLLAFGGSRTYHRITCAIEDAGWEIRDCIMWLYGSGFPKSLDISKAIDKTFGAERPVISVEKRSDKRNGNYHGASESRPPIDWKRTEAATVEAQLWNGYGTALKPAYEPIILAMKPLDGTFANNAEKWGVAGINIDGGRIETDDKGTPIQTHNEERSDGWGMKFGAMRDGPCSALGRFPSNVILDEEAAAMLDEQSGELTSGKPCGIKAGGQKNAFGIFKGGIPVTGVGDSGGASRFFYTAKASPSERGKFNNHPTVKPLSLMQYLVRLTKTPTGGIVLDPFCGSGSTLIACKKEGRAYIGIDEDAETVRTADKRLLEHCGGLF